MNLRPFLPRTIQATVLTMLLAATCRADDPATKPSVTPVEPFTGKIVFHQTQGPTVYEVIVTKNMVTGGNQHTADSKRPFAQIVGGWYHHDEGRLVLLIQGQPEDLAERWLSQAQQFRVDAKARQITLEHMLYGYGLGIDDPELSTAHVLDSLEGVVRLTTPD